MTVSRERDKVKGLIILSVFDYLHNKKSEDRKQAITYVEQFAKFYSVPLIRKPIQPSLRIHIREFVINKQGYNDTIPRLYNSLLRSEP